MKTYYVVRTGQDRFELRQTRYTEQFERGDDHPHDVMAQGFSEQGMRDIIARWFPDTDTSALDATVD